MKKKNITSIFLVMFVFLLAVFALGSLLTNVIVQSPINGTNLSGIIALEVNFTTAASVNENITNVTWRWVNITSGGTPLNTSVANSTESQTANFTNSSFDTTLLADGTYNLTVEVHNLTDGIFSNRSIQNIVIDNTAPNVTFELPLNGSNYTATGNQQFNVSVDDSLAGVQNVTFSFANGTTNIRDTSINFSGDNSSGTWNVTVDLSTFNDDQYTVIVYANDTTANGTNAGNLNDTTNITFFVDGTSPTLSIDTINDSNFTSTYSLNLSATVADNLLDVQTVYFSISNGTTNTFNITASNSSGAWNASILGSRLIEGEHNVTAVANDSLGNTNTSNNITIRIDTSKPNVTGVTISNIKEDAADIEAIGFDDATNLASCQFNSTTTSNATLNRFNKTNFRLTFGSLVGATTYSLTVNCTDSAGNFNDSNTVSFTTTAVTTAAATSSSGGGGGGSSSQTSTSSTAGVSKKKTWQALEAGLDVTFDIGDSGIPVTSLKFTAEKIMYGAWIQVKNEDKLPARVDNFGRKIVHRLQLSKSSGVRDDRISDVTVDFNVLKSLLSEKGVDKTQISLWRFNEQTDVWDELPTTRGTETPDQVSYMAVTPGFSYFVIGQASGITPTVEEAAAEAAREAGEAVPAAGGDVSADTVGEEAADGTSSGGAGKWVITIVVLLIIAGAAYYLFGRKKK